MTLFTRLSQAWGSAGSPAGSVVPCVRFTCVVQLYLVASSTVATLGRSGWLDLPPPGLPPGKKRQAQLGALTLSFSRTSVASVGLERFVGQQGCLLRTILLRLSQHSIPVSVRSKKTLTIEVNHVVGGICYPNFRLPCDLSKVFQKTSTIEKSSHKHQARLATSKQGP